LEADGITTALENGDAADYPGIDMASPAGGQPAIYTHRDGTPYKDIRRRGPDA
jgi:hypothetical protein